MKTIYNNILDRASLPHNEEGLRIYNNMLVIRQSCRKLDRMRMLKRTYMKAAMEVI